MQDEINEKVVALSVKGAKLTAEMLQKAIKAMLAQAKKQQEKQPHGKQTLKQLAKQNAGLSNIEITEGNIKAFEQTAKKYGIDFALKKDSTETPPRYLVFFKGRDADALTAAFKEFSAKKLTQEQKPSIRKALAAFLRHKDGQAVFPAQPDADVAYSVIGALVGNILVVVYKVYRTKNDVVMDMPFIYVSGKDVFILPLCYRVGKLFSDFMGFLIIDFPRLKRLYQMVCEVVSSVKSLRQCKSELNICRFIAAPERGHQHFPVRLVRVLDIVKGFF